MYNKLFTRILDSSIWLEPTPTRIVWLTCIAVMDADGFVQFASVANVAHRARVTLQEATDAITCLESPDGDSSDPDHEGTRIERVPGGWIVLNADKYRAMATRDTIREQTRDRVKRHRDKRNNNAPVTPANEKLTPSDSDAEADVQAEATKKKRVSVTHAREVMAVSTDAPDDWLQELYGAYPKNRVTRGQRTQVAFFDALGTSSPRWRAEWNQMRANLENHKQSHEWRIKGMIPALEKWLRDGLWTRQMSAAAPAGEQVSAKTARTLSGAAAFLAGGE